MASERVATAIELELEDSARELQQAPIFCKLTLQEIAQIVPTIVHKKLEQGDHVYKVGDLATHVYFVVSGTVRLEKDGRNLDLVTRNGFLGTESVLDIAYNQVDAIAQAPTKLLVIPCDAVLKMLALNPERRLDFYSVLVGQLSTAKGPSNPTEAVQVVAKRRMADEKRREELLKKSRFIGWGLAMIVPLLVRFVALNFWGLDVPQAIFLMVLSTAVVMWMFSLVPEFIAGIFAIMALLVMGVAPPSETLAGFASGSYFMALSLFALGSIVGASGLSFRLVLIISRYLPNKSFWYAFALMFNGLSLTPILPSANGRISILSRVLTEMVEAIRLKRGGVAATYLSTAAFMGASLFAAMFLSSKSANFIVFGLLPAHFQHQYGWVFWLTACLVALALMLALYIGFTTFYFRSEEVPRITREQVRAQLRILGRVSVVEWVAITSVLLFLVGTLTAPIHKIALPWIGLAVLYLLLALGLMGKQEFKSRIDWSFLVLLGSLVGLARAMSFLGIDDWFGENLAWLGQFMKEDFGLFVIILFALIALSRLALPNTATVALFATVLLPLADVNGANPWLVGLLILNFSDAWFMPYQCSYYLLFRNSVPEGFFDERKLLTANLVSVVFRIAAVYASIPYWKWLGVL